jgi:hypothetical protein
MKVIASALAGMDDAKAMPSESARSGRAAPADRAEGGRPSAEDRLLAIRERIEQLKERHGLTDTPTASIGAAAAIRDRSGKKKAASPSVMTPDGTEGAAAPVTETSRDAKPSRIDLDAAIAEISARQRVIDEGAGNSGRYAMPQSAADAGMVATEIAALRKDVMALARTVEETAPTASNGPTAQRIEANTTGMSRHLRQPRGLRPHHRAPDQIDKRPTPTNSTPLQKPARLPPRAPRPFGRNIASPNTISADLAPARHDEKRMAALPTKFHSALAGPSHRVERSRLLTELDRR